MVEVVLRHRGRSWDLSVEVRDGARAADLIEALVPATTPGDDDRRLRVGAHVLGSEAALESALADGVEVEVLAVGAGEAPGWPEVQGPAAGTLRVVGGLHAGRRAALREGRNVVPEPAGGATVVAVEAGRARVEATAPSLGPGDLELEPAPPALPPAGAPPCVPGPVDLRRPPRDAFPAPPGPVPVPAAPAAPRARSPILGLAALGPLVGAGLLVAATGDARFALLAALSPLTGAFAAVDQRRRARGESRAQRRRFDEELTAFRAALGDAGTQATARLDARAPSLATVLDRIERLEGLWVRSSADPDFDDHLVLRAGQGDVSWSPPLATPAHPHPELASVLAAASVLPGAPVLVDLGRGGVAGVCGPRAAALAVVRSFVLQAAAHHGPGDLHVAVVSPEGGSADWEWAKWLPHTRAADPSEPRSLAVGTAAGAELLARLSARPSPPALLLVLDGPRLAVGRSSPVASLLASPWSPAAVVVLAGDRRDLPASASTVIELDPACAGPARAVLAHPQVGERVRFAPCGLDGGVALAAAQRLARLRDTDATRATSALPASVSLAALLGLDGGGADAVRRRWLAAGGCGAVPIGVGADGPVAVDLDVDGPHVLVAGTTGAGKSELLRSLVVGLAATLPPSACTFVLVDFKGGAAFDGCARLPHSVGLVTDLDAGLAARALRSLEAEVRHREEVLRSAGCRSIAEHRAAGGPGGPLPRLVVVVDEFATLKHELPGFVESLVSIAQRGRSLGVHLVLATQRPSGAVSDDIRANTDLRIALRVQEPAESADVVGTPAAAHLPRSRPGRAVVRRGPTEVLEVQTAHGDLTEASAPPVSFRPFAFGAGSAPAPAGAPVPGGGLGALVAAISAAHTATGEPAPRRPWTDPLPGLLPVATLAPVERPPDLPSGTAGPVPYGLVDLPDEQRQATAVWHPDRGHLLVVGSAGSGTTSTLRALAHGIAGGTDPTACHLYGLDFDGGGGLRSLAALPHCGDVLDPSDPLRHLRLLRLLREEASRRRTAPPARSIVVLVDGLPALLAVLAEHGDGPVEDLLVVLADGPALGIHVAATADRPAAVPAAVSSHLGARLALPLADPLDGTSLGPAVARTRREVPGRAVDPATGHLLQVAWAPSEALASLGGALGAARTAPPVRTLPAVVAREDLVARSRATATGLELVVGRRDRDLDAAVLEVRDGEHVLVAGPSRAGVSTALATLAAAALAAGSAVEAVCPARSGLVAALPAGVACAAPGDIGAVLERLAAAPAARGGARALVLDDAHDLDDPAGALARLLVDPPPGLVVLAGGRAEVLRTAYGHWTRAVRRSRLGLLLAPVPELDGDLLGVRLPRSTGQHGPAVPGRGHLVEAGAAELVQVATGPADR